MTDEKESLLAVGFSLSDVIPMEHATAPLSRRSVNWCANCVPNVGSRSAERAVIWEASAEAQDWTVARFPRTFPVPEQSSSLDERFALNTAIEI